MGNNGSKTSSAQSMYSAGASMVSSNSGLSLFDMPVNRENRNVVVNLLSDLRMPIIAVWLVSRPIDRTIGSSFEHWCVKIQAQGCLISIDFLESQGKGAYGLQQRTDIGAELDEFMYYGVKDREAGKVTKHKWEIIASVTPHPFRNATYINYLSDYDRVKLISFVKNAQIAPKDPSKFLKDIQCDKRVCDIANFCSVFTADGKGYNPLTRNCQQFAAELFAYLVGDNYKSECGRIFERYQSPFDQKQYKDAKTQVSESISVIEYQKKYSKNKPKAKHHRKHRKKPKPKTSENSRHRRTMQSDEFFPSNPPNSPEFLNASSIDYQSTQSSDQILSQTS